VGYGMSTGEVGTQTSRAWIAVEASRRSWVDGPTDGDATRRWTDWRSLVPADPPDL
jgi:hypothetical protein